MKTINITEATAPQLVAFAQNTLNIEGVSTSMAKAAIIAKIKAVGYDSDTILVEDSAPKTVTPAGAGDVSERKMVKVIIQSSDAPGGQDPVPVSVNGSAMLIPRDVEAEIPFEYYEALRNAVRQHYTPLPDGGLSEPKDVPAYAFSKVA